MMKKGDILYSCQGCWDEEAGKVVIYVDKNKITSIRWKKRSKVFPEWDKKRITLHQLNSWNTTNGRLNIPQSTRDDIKSVDVGVEDTQNMALRRNGLFTTKAMAISADIRITTDAVKRWGLEGEELDQYKAVLKALKSRLTRERNKAKKEKKNARK